MPKDTNTSEIIKSIMSLISIKDKVKGITILENGDYQIETGLGYFPSFPKIKSACEFRGIKVFNGPVDGIKYVVVPNNVYKKYLFRRKLMRLKKDFYDE